MKKDLDEKNKRRKRALEGMRFEIADEAAAREDDYMGYDDDYEDDYPDVYMDD